MLMCCFSDKFCKMTHGSLFSCHAFVVGSGNTCKGPIEAVLIKSITESVVLFAMLAFVRRVAILCSTSAGVSVNSVQLLRLGLGLAEWRGEDSRRGSRGGGHAGGSPIALRPLLCHTSFERAQSLLQRTFVMMRERSTDKQH